jgi:hypothetical protein
MPRAIAFALTATLLAATPPPPDDTSPAPAPNSAVVGGHRIQPRASSGQTAPDAGISKRDADDVDRLYQELMRQTAPDATKIKGSSPPQ